MWYGIGVSMEEMYVWLKENLADKGYKPEKILDIGAWNGFWTINAKTFWPDSNYTCIEAGQKHEDNLKKVADQCHIAVLGDENKEVDMYINPVGYTKGATLLPASTNKKKKPDRRTMQTLDTLVGKDAKFDFIKQDIQGAEILCMKGRPEIFQRADYVLNEVNLFSYAHSPNTPCRKSMDEYMRSIGFPYAISINTHFGDPKQVDRLYSKKEFN